MAILSQIVSKHCDEKLFSSQCEKNDDHRIVIYVCGSGKKTKKTIARVPLSCKTQILLVLYGLQYHIDDISKHSLFTRTGKLLNIDLSIGSQLKSYDIVYIW